MKPFILEERHQIHLINLEETAKQINAPPNSSAT
ncbi:MAG: hypothetical protein R3F11_00800 [Verrucomicrobiales bacterium]